MYHQEGVDRVKYLRGVIKNYFANKQRVGIKSQLNFSPKAGLTMNAAIALQPKLVQHWTVEHYKHLHRDGTRCHKSRRIAFNGTLTRALYIFCQQILYSNDVCTEPVHKAELLWRGEFDNQVTTTGLNKYLDATLKTGLASPAWYVGLIDNTGYTAYAVGDTAAKITLTADPPTTNGWQETEPYSDATRVAFTPGTISGGSVDNSESPAVFHINDTKTVRGAFLDDASGKHATTGVLLGEGDFGTARDVISGDSLNVTVTCSITAS